MKLIKNPTISKGHGVLLVVLLMCAVAARVHGADKSDPSKARLELARTKEKPSPQATPIPFQKTDYLRLTAEPPPATIYLGEPYVMRLRLVNHTQFNISASADFSPRGSLDIEIQPPNGRKYRYKGPFPDGKPPQNDYPLFPMEEFPVDIMVWSDPSSPNGLAFSQPGVYQVEVKLLAIGVQHSGRTGELDPLGPNLQPLPPFTVSVLEPKPDFAPLVQELGMLKAYPYLHLKRLREKGAPPDLADRLIKLVEKYPATPITPYLDYNIALGAWNDNPELKDNEKFAIAANYYQRAAIAPSAYKDLALIDLVRIFDKRGESKMAREASAKLIANASSPFAARIYGSMPFVKKYLVNSSEISPKAYWNLLQ